MSVDLATISRADVARVSAFLHEHLDAEVSAERWARAEAMRHAPEAADIAALTNRLAELLGTAQT